MNGGDSSPMLRDVGASDDRDAQPGWLLTVRGTVYPWQCDHMGHMNVMWYTGRFDEATWQLLAAIGLTASRFKADESCMAAVEQHTEYKRELHAGDTITIRSSVLDVKDKAIRLRHEMTNDETGDVAAFTTITGVHIDAHARKARPLPVDVRERAAHLCAAAAATTTA
jgi:acyl-CoA thioester hydrolase